MLRSAPTRCVLLACALLSGCARHANAPKSVRAPEITESTPRGADMAGARELDQQGVRAFREGRYNDAVMYFRESFRLGAPPSALWNVGRALERLDDPEGASRAFDDYLAQGVSLTADERVQAQRELSLLRGRASVITVVSHPNGATVFVDGQPAAGTTPLTLEVPPGQHTIGLAREGFASKSHALEARFGRGIVLETTMVAVSNSKGQP